MLSSLGMLTAVFLLQSVSLSLGWIPVTSLQSYATGHLQVMHPPQLLLANTPHFYPDFQKPKTQSFFSATLSPLQPPVYRFRYRIHDPKEDNYQEKAETRVGDSVRGYYSVREPNGYVRLVRYVSDENGFQTEVSHHHADDHGVGHLFTQPRRLT